LEAIESEWFRDYKDQLPDYQSAKELHTVELSAWKEGVKRAYKEGQARAAKPKFDRSEPIQRRLVVNDATFETLHQIMANHPEGIILVRDELTGWLATLERKGREGERQFALEAWNGDRPFTMDRIGRGQIRAEC